MGTRESARVVLILVTVAGIVMMLGLFAPGAGASHVAPSERPGNPSCKTFGDWSELKVEPVSSGTYSDGMLSVSVSVAGDTFSWSSNIGVDAVFVKGGPNGNLYSYSPEATSDSGLSAPINDSNNRPYGLSHISFCYDFEQPPPTPPRTTSPPASTPPVTPPPTTMPPPDVLPTTITAPPSSPGEIPPSVLPTLHSASPSPEDRDRTPTPEDSVLPKVIEQPGVLPLTGAGLSPLVGVALVLLASGGGVYLTFRKRF